MICTNESWLDSSKIFKEISQLAKKTNCDLKSDRRSGKLQFTPKSVENRNALIEELRTRPDFEYYTYGTKQERRPAKKVVAKGVLSSGYTEHEIIDDIETRYGLKPERALPLKNSAMILIFNGERDMRDIKNITTILCQKVKIERYKVKLTAVTQCKRCLQFGHVQAHCGIKQRNETEKETDSDGNVVEICSNCRVPGHTARQAKCPQFKEEIKKQRERRLRFINANKVQSESQSTMKQQIINNKTIKPGVTYAQTVKILQNATETSSRENTTNETTQNKTTNEILEKMLTMIQVTQQQMMDQMVQLLTLIKRNG